MKSLRAVVWGTGIVIGALVLEPPPCSAQTPAPSAQAPATPLRLLKPEYTLPYSIPSPESITEILNRIHGYLDTVTPARLVDSKTGAEITDRAKINQEAIIERGDFRIISYEWGVTYSAMLLAGQVTGDQRFNDYVAKRMRFIAELAPVYRPLVQADPQNAGPLRSVIAPRSLDDSGSMCAAMIKSLELGKEADLQPLIDHYMHYISNEQLRLQDGTLARNVPHPHTLWLDDLYMSVPALAQMGRLTGEKRYYDDAVKQILQFSERMFNKDLGIYMHGWVEGMQMHPEFHWARANGWAAIAMVELLEVLPDNHPAKGKIIKQLTAHLRGLTAYQSGSGFWHQLLDRSDSYLETSATAMFSFCLARAINRGWLDANAFGPAALLAWNALTTQINRQGQVDKVCIGTGMAFDPVFYYFRPTSVFAAHGYGPALMAGAEMITLLKNYRAEVFDHAVQFFRH